MDKLIKISLIIFAFALIGNKSFSQTSLAYYNSSDSKIGLAHHFTEKIWGEARLSLTFEDLNTEFVLCYDALKLKDYNFYVGLGAQIRDESGFVIPIGVQLAPFENFKNLSLHVELLPIFTDYESMLQSSIGIRYTFGKSKSNKE